MKLTQVTAVAILALMGLIQYTQSRKGNVHYFDWNVCSDILLLHVLWWGNLKHLPHVIGLCTQRSHPYMHSMYRMYYPTEVIMFLAIHKYLLTPLMISTDSNFRPGTTSNNKWPVPKVPDAYSWTRQIYMYSAEHQIKIWEFFKVPMTLPLMHYWLAKDVIC